jgi:cephalosporin hydroxylase
MSFNSEKFHEEVSQNIANLAADFELHRYSQGWINQIARHKYAYNFKWFDRPIIQIPQDIVAMQEIIWAVKPDLIIETGIAHGGSLIFSASMLALLEYCDAVEKGEMLKPANPKRRVLGIDIDIRAHNRKAIMEHPMSGRIDMIEGSSIAPEIITQVHSFAQDYQRILVCLDSMHTYDHVLAELEAYSPLVSKGSYCVVFDTIIEDMPEGFFKDRPWDKGNNPKTAVWKFLKTHSEFEIDKQIEHKLLITVAPDGYLKKKFSDK